MEPENGSDKRDPLWQCFFNTVFSLHLYSWHILDKSSGVCMFCSRKEPKCMRASIKLHTGDKTKCTSFLQVTLQNDPKGGHFSPLNRSLQPPRKRFSEEPGAFAFFHFAGVHVAPTMVYSTKPSSNAGITLKCQRLNRWNLAGAIRGMMDLFVAQHTCLSVNCSLVVTPLKITVT